MPRRGGVRRVFYPEDTPRLGLTRRAALGGRIGLDHAQVTVGIVEALVGLVAPDAVRRARQRSAAGLRREQHQQQRDMHRHEHGNRNRRRRCSCA